MNKDALKTAIDSQVIELRTVEQAEELLKAWEFTLQYAREEIEKVLPNLIK